MTRSGAPEYRFLFVTTALGIPGYTFADLHHPDRLAPLSDRFCEEVRAADPAFWLEWDGYRRAPDTTRPPLVLSNLLIGMASHVSRATGPKSP